MNGRFAPGAHIQVRRPRFYFHHGIYVSDERVIQFGSGIALTPAGKGRAAITDVSLAEFEHGGTAEVVRHGYESPFTGHHPASDEAWKVIARAEFLLKLQPALPYNLIGHNCEIIANMCASGSWTESYQVRRFFAARAAIDIPLMLYIAWLSRRKLPVPGWVSVAMVMGFAATIGVKTTYDSQIRRFWQEIRTDWEAHEHMLSNDPRNEPQS